MELSLSSLDRRYLQRAIDLGKRGWGGVHPNPLVGCVLVKDGQIVAEGWHKEYGGPHAETLALEGAGERAMGATAYVSLEPCNHTGKTPPCSQALLDAGVVRIVYGAGDPGKESAGGAEALQEWGVEVIGPCLTYDQAWQENPSFFWNQENGTTFVAIKLAQTLDGKIAEAPGHRTSITGPEALEETHRLRAGFDGVLVGSRTVLVDDPFLTVRHGIRARRQPWRIVLDTDARTSPEANLFKDLPDAPLVIFTADDAPDTLVRGLEEAGARIHRVPRSGGGLLIPDVLAACWDMGIRSLLCEGGGTLASGLLRHGWARRIYLFMAPFVLGEQGVPAFPGAQSRIGWESWKPAGSLGIFGRDVLLTFDRIEGCSQES
jgi:diaminohydroxyphosphoribosylaminopyrimidine deaminase/5-amino-6-(5-phosphoribosylamino)uracil reductase